MSRAISTRPDRSLNAPKPLFLTADPAGGCPFKFILLMACRTRFSLRFEKPHKRVLRIRLTAYGKTMLPIAENGSSPSEAKIEIVPRRVMVSNTVMF